MGTALSLLQQGPMGFAENGLIGRISNHVLWAWLLIHPVIETPINAQKKKDGTAKAYQIKQAINIIDGE